MKEKKGIRRREFIRSASVAVAGGAFALTGRHIPAAAPEGKSRVVLVRDETVLSEAGKPVLEIVRKMLDTAICELTGFKDPVKAWKSILKPEDIVGIKSNVYPNISTTQEVEQALKQRVMDAGVKESDIAVDDRGVLRSPVFRRSTALINARPMRSHHWSGVGSLIKNYVMFVPDPQNSHGDSCASLGSIWHNPLVKGKTRLNVLVMLTPQFHGVGPHSFNPRYVWKYHGLMLGFDPVAVDTMGLKIIEGIRNEYFGEARPLNPPAKHIILADSKYGLGTSDPARIELVKLGYDQKSFI